jgi:K+-sensing histidine kinase KdpD
VVVEAEARGQEVELRVRDNGTGIQPELMNRIFEPHFSTRSTGTGLGLAIVRRLVESWGGTISAESRLGEGTVMRVMLSVWEGEDPEVPDSPMGVLENPGPYAPETDAASVDSGNGLDESERGGEG